MSETAVKEIYCVRHTTPAIELVYAYGQSDIDVAESFEKEADRSRSVLPKDLSEYKIISSPLKRCVKLARFFADEVHIDSRLMEIGFGEWEMKPWAEIEQLEGYARWRADFVNIAAPGGESFRQMADRVMAFHEQIKAMDEKGYIIVSHGGAIRALIAGITGMPLENLFQINIDFGGVTLIKTFASKPDKIIFINR